METVKRVLMENNTVYTYGRRRDWLLTSAFQAIESYVQVACHFSFAFAAFLCLRFFW
jgi:hypothetical protein